MKYYMILILSIFFSNFIFAQTAMPITDISMIKLNTQFQAIKASTAILIERRDYDNQPHFATNNLLYWTRHSDGQTDIWQMNLLTQQQSALTQTTESEYSPTLMPGAKRFSVVRVEQDGSQRLWSFDLTGQSAALILDKIKPVGYHVWLNAETLALFILGKTMTLQLANTSTDKTQLLATDIGRSLHKVPGKNAVSYSIHRGQQNEIHIFDIESKKNIVVTDTLEGSQDYVWLPDSSLLMGQGNRIFRFKDENWQLWAEFPALTDITRLAISPDGTRLAFVHGRKVKDNP